MLTFFKSWSYISVLVCEQVAPQTFLLTFFKSPQSFNKIKCIFTDRYRDPEETESRAVTGYPPTGPTERSWIRWREYRCGGPGGTQYSEGAHSAMGPSGGNMWHPHTVSREMTPGKWVRQISTYLQYATSELYTLDAQENHLGSFFKMPQPCPDP